MQLFNDIFINHYKSLEDMDEKRREDLILEAICGRGCRTIQSISDSAKLECREVRRIINSVGLLSDLKEMRINDKWQLIRKHYTYGMSRAELSERTGISAYRLVGLVKKAAKELTSAREEIAGLVDLIVTKKANEDPLALYALGIVKKPYTKLDFRTVYQRVVDVHNLTRKECYIKWGLTDRQGVSDFIRRYGLQYIAKKPGYK